MEAYLLQNGNLPTGASTQVHNSHLANGAANQKQSQACSHAQGSQQSCLQDTCLGCFGAVLFGKGEKEKQSGKVGGEESHKSWRESQ